jgi:hypothetical protein
MQLFYENMTHLIENGFEQVADFLVFVSLDWLKKSEDCKHSKVAKV